MSISFQKQAPGSYPTPHLRMPSGLVPSFREAEHMRVLRDVEGLEVVLVEELFATTNTFQKVHAWFAGARRRAIVIVPR